METRKIKISYIGSGFYFLPDEIEVCFTEKFRMGLENASKVCKHNEWDFIGIQPDDAVRFYFEDENNDQIFLTEEEIEIISFMVDCHYTVTIRFYNSIGEYAEFESFTI